MNILLINGHPRPSSFSAQIAQAYLHGLSKTAHAHKLLELHNLKFDLNLSQGYKTVLEHDLVHAQEQIAWADHIVFVYPLWWWSMPALLKGFIDRVFVPGFAFQYEGKPLPTQLFKGKTATLIVTMDGPTWYYKLWMKATGHVMMKRGVLAYCGVKTIKSMMIDNHMKLTDVQKDKWLQKIASLAAAL